MLARREDPSKYHPVFLPHSSTPLVAAAPNIQHVAPAAAAPAPEPLGIVPPRAVDAQRRPVVVTVSVAVVHAVLDVIEREHLVESARLMGQGLRDGLLALAKKHPRISAVRGAGLYYGVEHRELFLSELDQAFADAQG